MKNRKQPKDSKKEGIKLLIALILLGLLLIPKKQLEGEYETFKLKVNNNSIIVNGDLEEQQEIIVEKNLDDCNLFLVEGQEIIGSVSQNYEEIEQEHYVIGLDGENYILLFRPGIGATTYRIVDEEMNVLANVQFDLLDTYAKITDLKYNIIAEVNPNLLRQNYTIRVSEESEIPYEAICLIFAAYCTS